MYPLRQMASDLSHGQAWLLGGQPVEPVLNVVIPHVSVPADAMSQEDVVDGQPTSPVTSKGKQHGGADCGGW